MDYNKKTTLFGYPAALVLTDVYGEFEVAGAIKVVHSISAPVVIDMDRVAAAICRREEAMQPPTPSTRPVY